MSRWDGIDAAAAREATDRAPSAWSALDEHLEYHTTPAAGCELCEEAAALTTAGLLRRECERRYGLQWHHKGGRTMHHGDAQATPDEIQRAVLLALRDRWEATRDPLIEGAIRVIERLVAMTGAVAP